MLHIIDVEYQSNFNLELSFSNGKKGIVNLEKQLKGQLYAPLKEKNKFIQFGLINGALEWINGADFSPGFLFDLMLQQQAAPSQKIN